MVVYVEHAIGRNAKRGAGKFMSKLIPALKKIGVDVSGINPTVILSTQSWKQNSTVRVPRVIRIDGAWDKPRKNRKYTRRILRSQIKIWQSNFCKNYSSRILGVPADGRVVYNGDDPNYYKRADFIDCHNKKHVYVCANWLTIHGKQRKIKRLIDTINIAKVYTAIHKDVEFWFAGDTGNIRSSNPNLKFLGRLNHQDLVSYMMAANVMLDLEWFAWCPNTVVEALVAGLPVIALNNGGAAELVRQGWGEILPIEVTPNIQDYMAKRVPVIPFDPIYAALDRWINCETKQPAKKLFINEIAHQYKVVLEEASI